MLQCSTVLGPLVMLGTCRAALSDARDDVVLTGNEN